MHHCAIPVGELGHAVIPGHTCVASITVLYRTVFAGRQARPLSVAEQRSSIDHARSGGVGREARCPVHHGQRSPSQALLITMSEA